MKQYEGASMGVIGKALGDLWKKTSAADRAPFESKAAAQKKTYEAKKEKYEKTANYKKFQMELLAWKIHETKKPFGKDENAPKRSLSAYMLYAASVRSQIVKENPDMAVTEVMREQSAMWKALSDAEQQKWKNKAAEGKKKYDAKLARYMKTADYQNHVQAREAYKAEMLEKRNKLMGIKKRARTPAKVKGKGEPKSPSKKKQKRRSARRSRTPKSSKSRSVSRRRRSAKSPKDPKKRSRKRRAVKRRSRAPKGSKRSTSRSTSRRRARTPKAPKRRSANKEKKSARKAKRRSRTPKASKSRSASRSSSRRSSKKRARTPKAPKKVEDSDA